MTGPRSFYSKEAVGPAPRMSDSADVGDSVSFWNKHHPLQAVWLKLRGHAAGLCNWMHVSHVVSCRWHLSYWRASLYQLFFFFLFTLTLTHTHYLSLSLSLILSIYIYTYKYIYNHRIGTYNGLGSFILFYSTVLIVYNS